MKNDELRMMKDELSVHHSSFIVHRFALHLAAATLFLIVVGGLVTSNEAGDSVPDWPLSFGQVVPWKNLVGNVVYEYGHRVVAATVGLLTILLNLRLWRHEPRRWVRRVGLAALVLVILQGTLGGVRVLLLEYRFPVAVIHACLAQLFFSLVVSLTVFTSRNWSAAPWLTLVQGSLAKNETNNYEPRTKDQGLRTAFYLCVAAVVSIFVQLILGAAFRHQGIGIVPHIIGAVVVTILLGWAVYKVNDECRMQNDELKTNSLSVHRSSFIVHRSYLVRPAKIAAGLLVLQLILGVSAYLARVVRADHPQPLEPMISLTVAHVAVGALVLAAAVVLWLRIWSVVRDPWSVVKDEEQRTTDPGTTVEQRTGDNGQRTMDNGQRTRDQLLAYAELTKPRLSTLIVLVAVAGFCLGSPAAIDGLGLLYTTVGTSLLAGGIFTLNQYLERNLDAVMRRTSNRPLPAGRASPRQALTFGLALSALAIAGLTLLVNPLSGLLALFTWGSYLFIYTPLKTRTPLCTLVGAFPGAMPPLLGWAAARGELGAEAWVLFAILFLWQFPHFLAIGWLYRDDYARAGVRMLPVIEPDGVWTGRQIVTCLTMLLPVSLLPAWMGVSGSVYLVGAVVLGLAFFYLGLTLAWQKSKWQARQLLLGSIVYLPLLFGLMVFG